MSNTTDMIIDSSSSDIKDETISNGNDTVDTTKATEITAEKSLEVSIEEKNRNKDKQDSENSNNNNTDDKKEIPNNNGENINDKGTTTTNTEDSTSEDSNNNNNNTTADNTPSTPLAQHTQNTINDSKNNNNNNNTEESHSSTGKIRSVRDFGVSFEKNARFRRTMEDEHVIIDCFGGDVNQGYFAIYDGHGGRGAVEFTAKTLHNNLLEELNKSPNGDVLELFKNSYLLTDKQIGESDIHFSGTTSITTLIRKSPIDGEKYIYCANAGDARAVVCHNKIAERLSYDHKGTDQEEIKRIDAAGGFVCNGRVNGILAVTRSLGDYSMKEHVIGDPYKRSIKLDSGHSHLILACDGLWDVVSDQEAVDLILSETEAQKMSEKLVTHALKRGSTDNISIIVVIL